MPRKSKQITCTRSDIQNLLHIVEKCPSARLAQRARMVIMCAEGRLVKDIAAELGERPNTVILWRDRFVKEGISSLRNLPRGRQKAEDDKSFKMRLLQKIDDQPPAGYRRWTGNLLSAELGVSKHTVWRCLRMAGIRLTEKSIGRTTPFEFTLNLSIYLTLKKENIMAKEKTHEKSDIKLTATITKSDGTVIEKTISMERAIPDIDDFDFGTRTGFLADLDMYENSMRSARDQLMSEITQSYMSSKKKKRKTKEPGNLEE